MVPISDISFDLNPIFAHEQANYKEFHGLKINTITWLKFN